jgi:CheY-like chemotaxis protein
MKGYIQIDSQSVIPNTVALKMVIPVELPDSDSSGLSNVSDAQYFYYKGKPLNLLVADDNDVNLFFVESVIKRFKGKCRTVKDGVEVLDELKKSEYDGILLDIQMPKKDGKNTLKEIRSMSGPISKIPVIAVSAFASEEEKNKILAAGAQKYLGKPFFPNDLYEAISSVFELDKTLPAEESKVEDKCSTENKENTESDKNKKTFSEKLKRINYREFELRLAPNSKTIVKLEEIYNRRCSALNIEVDNCIYNDDSAKLREVAHSIKGLVGMMAADESWQIAKDIEQKAGEGNLQEAINKISELRIHLAEISADLKIIKEVLK